MAGFLSPATREQIRAASDIVDVIGSYLPLKRAGTNFTALCPFHKEKSPSFNVNPHKQIFHCFGCHKGGDVFTFVKDYENIGFMDAVRRLAERAKIPLEFENSPGEQQSRHLKDQLLQIHDQITQRWQNCLANEAAGQLARDYLQKRGVSADAIKLFRIGAAPELWDDTVNWAKSKNYDPDLVEKAGLIIRKEETGNYYDRFRGRLMFPICDEQGRVVGFSGRVLSGDEKTAKYVNSPETAIFTKSKIFFGLDKSKRAILDAGYAIICEGQLDLIACFMNGVQNIVAPQGTAFTADHARILKRYTNEAVLCFDSDEAGQNAAMRSLDNLLASDMASEVVLSELPWQQSLKSLLASGLAVRVVIIPSPHDPDSFIKANGGEAFRKLVQSASGFFDFYLNRLCSKNDVTTDRGRLVVLQGMGEAIRKTDNQVLIDKYAKKTAQVLGVTPEAVLLEFKKIPAVKISVEDEEFETTKPEMARPSPLEFYLLKLLFLHDDLVAWTAAHLDLNWILHPATRQTIDLRLAAHEHETWQNLGAFLDGCESAEQRSLITEAVAEERKIPNPQTQLADLTLKLRNQFLDRQIGALTQKIGQPQTSDAEKIELLREQLKLKELKRAPLSPLPK
jgi:DNA primase